MPCPASWRGCTLWRTGDGDLGRADSRGGLCRTNWNWRRSLLAFWGRVALYELRGRRRPRLRTNGRTALAWNFRALLSHDHVLRRSPRFAAVTTHVACTCALRRREWPLPAKPAATRARLSARVCNRCQSHGGVAKGDQVALRLGALTRCNVLVPLPLSSANAAASGL